MIPFLDYVLVAVAGVLTKITDNIADEGFWDKRVGYATATVYGSVVGYLLSQGSVLSTLIIAIAAGNLVFGRIDHRIHQIAIACALVVMSLFGISRPDAVFLVVLGSAAWADEFLNERTDRKKEKTVFWKIAGYRPVLEIAALGVSLVSGDMNYIIIVLLFDFCYHLTDVITRPREGRRWKV